MHILIQFSILGISFFSEAKIMIADYLFNPLVWYWTIIVSCVFQYKHKTNKYQDEIFSLNFFSWIHWLCQAATYDLSASNELLISLYVKHGAKKYRTWEEIQGMDLAFKGFTHCKEDHSSFIDAYIAT